MSNKRWIWSAAVLLSGILQAEIYEWVDQNGRNHYSDRQQQDARQLKIAPVASPTANVAANYSGSYVPVARVYDGDTILLADDRKIRLLGVNTPEIAGRNKMAETGGQQARAWLQQALDAKQVGLQFDVEKEDKYHRTLAYVFTDDQRFINLELVKRGLATVNIFPPNFKYLDQLLAAQADAERQKLGLWAEAAYAPQRFDRVDDGNYKGWKRVTGKIRGLKQTAKYSYLQFSGDFSVKIENDWLSLFPDLQHYVGKQVEVRGWINRHKQQFSLHVRHPADIKRID